MHKFKIMMLPVEIDVKIVPIIEWLNSYKSVRTLYCCEGHDGRPESSYVTFTVNNQRSLKSILRIFELARQEDNLERGIKIYVDYLQLTCIRYIVRWYTKEDLENFKKFLTGALK